MKLYPTAAKRYVLETGRRRTVKSERTFMSLMAHLQYHVGPDTHVETVTADQLTRWCFSGTPSSGTIKNRRSVARSFFEWATWVGLCPSNPAADLKFTVTVPNRPVRPGNWYTEADITAFLIAAADHPDPLTAERDRLLILTGFLTGLRGGEIVSLRWSNFSADLTSVTLAGKGRKIATIAIPPQLRERLTDWRRHVPEGCDIVWPTMREDNVQRNCTGVNWNHAFGYSGLYRMTKRVAAAAGHPEFAPHDMRRTFASLLETKGVPVGDISRALRHGDIGITSRYLDRNPAKTVAVAADFTLNI